jgi:hypothetical protein
MHISLKLDAKPVRQRPYKLNPKYKEKVKAEMDPMLEATIIELVVESKWISPMVVQDNKIGGIMICVYLRKLNDACPQDPFPTPFINEVLENVGGNEAYSFIDGFSVLALRITLRLQEDKPNTHRKVRECKLMIKGQMGKDQHKNVLTPKSGLAYIRK